MQFKTRVFISEALTDAEHARLASRLESVVSRNQCVSSDSYNVLLAGLADATAWAKRSHDFAVAAHRDWALARSAERGILGRPRLGKKRRMKPLEGSMRRMRCRSKSRRPGRPTDAWKHALMHCVMRELRKAGLSCGWKTGHETTLTRVFRICADVAGSPQYGNLRGVWEQARSMAIVPEWSERDLFSLVAVLQRFPASGDSGRLFYSGLQNPLVARSTVRHWWLTRGLPLAWSHLADSRGRDAAGLSNPVVARI
jgi:hypothetical protein